VGAVCELAVEEITESSVRKLDQFSESKSGKGKLFKNMSFKI